MMNFLNSCMGLLESGVYYLWLKENIDKLETSYSRSVNNEFHPVGVVTIRGLLIIKTGAFLISLLVFCLEVRKKEKVSLKNRRRKHDYNLFYKSSLPYIGKRLNCKQAQLKSQQSTSKLHEQNNSEVPVNIRW